MLSNILNMLLRYTFCIISIIILLILGLMFFYFNNQIIHQNNKLNAMIDIISGLVQKPCEPIHLSCPFIPGKTNTEIPFHSIPSFLPDINKIDVSDSEDDETDVDDDSDDESDAGVCELENGKDNIGKDEININEIDIIDSDQCFDGICQYENMSDICNNTVQVLDVTDESVDKDTSLDGGDFSNESIQVGDNNITIEVSLDTSLSEPKHGVHNHKSLHLNELREMAIQLQLISSNEAKKMKKGDLIDIISKQVDHKSD